jgi:hypothetical protein
MVHAWERRDKCTRFWWESQKERDHCETVICDSDGMTSEHVSHQ